MQDVKFTDYHPFEDGKFLTIILKDGESFSLEHRQRTEEGWQQEVVSWELVEETVTKSWYSDGVDCDGRMEYSSNCACHISQLQKSPAWLYSEWIEGKGNENHYSSTIKVPEWENVRKHQRDHTAERMNY